VSRELKFRVWDPNTETMYTNVGIGKISFYDFDGDRITEQEGLIIMQWTGLKDRNGMEIYESDLFRTADAENVYIDIVVWSEKDGSWAFENAHGHCTVLAYDINLSHGEVIGNIYEHPHLLPKEEEPT